MASELKRDRRFIFRFYFALFLIFTNRQRGAKKVASHFAQLVLLPIVMHKTMHSLTGKDSVVEISYGRALWRNFLGQSPDWYKLALIIFLIVNPLVFAVAPFVAGWLLVVEFIFTLAMALKCYPLLPGGLLAIEALLIGMTSPGARPGRDRRQSWSAAPADVHGGGYLLYETAFAVRVYAPAAGDP
ncbi:sodium/proton antiporter [Klebsiella pneumoniae]|uniref:Sodium/proton antiporter n=1 Tax=Klebsiella pneumoniae TaxID=573 RepID=A0A2X3FBI0_KLEPN|nr:sodium/proton antiporter [Klebsiella pneumoniae]